MIPKTVDLAQRYENFDLLVLALTASLLVTGVGDSRAFTLSAGILNVLAVAVGFASSALRIRAPHVLLLIVLGGAGTAVVYTSPANGLAFGLGASAHALMLSVLTWAIVARIVRHPEVTGHTILGALAAYLLIGQVFAWIYLGLSGFSVQSVLDPSSTERLPIYYSYIVLTTVGFGDVTPTGAIAQRITVLEALLGQVFLAVLVARLVAAYGVADD